MGCAFCASGRDGFVRDLSAGEILSQVLLHAKEGISNIVLMGSGEPLDNFENVKKFLELVIHKDGINIGSRHISLSTVGLPKKIREFADMGTGVNLCISIHASNDEIRSAIMPMAKRYTIAEIMDASRYYFNKTGRRVIFEYSLIDGVNCDVSHAKELAKLMTGFPNHVNLIKLNDTGAGFRAPSHDIAMKFMDTLIKSGVSCTMRKSKGDDIDGACGQLRLKKGKSL